MSRIRTIKPEFWVNEQVTACSLQARLLFIGLWNFCDDNGVHLAALKSLKWEVLPDDRCSIEDIATWMGELIDNGLVSEYIAQGKSYWIVPTWKKHQKIDKPTYRHPLPDTWQSITGHPADDELRKVEQLPAPIPSAYEDSAILQPLGEDFPRTPLTIVDDSTNSGRTLAEYSASSRPRNGKESNGKEGKNIHRVAGAPRQMSSEQTIQDKTGIDEVQAVFNYWQTTLNHPRAVLDNTRRKIIQQALKNYTVESLKQAILGCSKSKFHMGNNDQNKRYDDISLILRNACNIEKFIEQASENSTPTSTITDNDIFAGAI